GRSTHDSIEIPVESHARAKETPVDFRMCGRTVHKADFLGPPLVTEECPHYAIKHTHRKFESLAGSQSFPNEHPANRDHPVLFLEIRTKGIGVQTDVLNQHLDCFANRWLLSNNQRQRPQVRQSAALCKPQSEVLYASSRRGIFQEFCDCVR